jgi:hypothetical protein
MKSTTIAIALTCFAAASCSTTSPLDLAASGGEQRLSHEDAVVTMSISEADRHRVDFLEGMYGRKSPIITGPIWASMFVGASDMPKLSIQAAVMQQNIEGAGFALRFTYRIDAMLSLNGRNFPIQASASRAAALNNVSAMRQAVELALKETAVKAQAIMDVNGR